MKRSKFSEEQIIGILREQEAVTRPHGSGPPCNKALGAEEDGPDVRKEAQARRDRCQAAGRVDVLTSQGQTVADAVRSIGVTEVT